MLTTEQLRARAESLGLDFFIERRAGIWVKEWLNDGCTSATAEEVLLWSMLANREAQPVMYASEETLAYAKEGEKSLVTWSEPMGDAVIPLFTVPPAPANAVAWEMRYWSDGYNMWGDWARITAEQHAEMSVQHAADNDYEFRVLYDAPPAPAVPDGFKLMPLEMTDEIGEAIAMEARCCGGIALCIYESALAAAPEANHDNS